MRGINKFRFGYLFDSINNVLDLFGFNKIRFASFSGFEKVVLGSMCSLKIALRILYFSKNPFRIFCGFNKIRFYFFGAQQTQILDALGFNRIRLGNFGFGRGHPWGGGEVTPCHKTRIKPRAKPLDTPVG